MPSVLRVQVGRPPIPDNSRQRGNDKVRDQPDSQRGRGRLHRGRLGDARRKLLLDPICVIDCRNQGPQHGCCGSDDRQLQVWFVAPVQSASMSLAVGVVIIGAGQAGLSLSHELETAGVEHVVLERGRVGETWRGRWDSFCLVIPNWTVQLPGGRYRGDDADGFMPKSAIVDHLVAYAESFRAPVREGVTVTSLEA